MNTAITVRHNMEMAHRLYLTPGKCENIHGHSWWVELILHGTVNDQGLLEGLNFTDVKRSFRQHLDSHFDHRLLLNAEDPFAHTVHYDLDTGPAHIDPRTGLYGILPGLQIMEGDPTTENVAIAISAWAGNEFHLDNKVVVHETSVNSAVAGYTSPSTEHGW